MKRAAKILIGIAIAIFLGLAVFQALSCSSMPGASECFGWYWAVLIGVLWPVYTIPLGIGVVLWVIKTYKK